MGIKFSVNNIKFDILNNFYFPELKFNNILLGSEINQKRISKARALNSFKLMGHGKVNLHKFDLLLFNGTASIDNFLSFMAETTYQVEISNHNNGLRVIKCRNGKTFPMSVNDLDVHYSVKDKLYMSLSKIWTSGFLRGVDLSFDIYIGRIKFINYLAQRLISTLLISIFKSLYLIFHSKKPLKFFSEVRILQVDVDSQIIDCRKNILSNIQLRKFSSDVIYRVHPKDYGFRTLKMMVILWAKGANFDFKKNIDHLLNKNFQFICVNSSLGVTLRHEKGESVTFIGCPECSVNIKHIDKIGNYKLYSLCEKKGMYE